MIINPCSSINGEISIPGDKSISHRVIMFGALANGLTEINNFLLSQDCLNTIECFRRMGVEIKVTNNKVYVYGRGLHGLIKPNSTLDVQNSGTSIRLLMGILAGQNFESTITGDKSIRRRPMRRITYPLSLMGAKFPHNNDFAPITISGGNLKSIDYTSDIASAQVKSSIIFASLYADSQTIYKEPCQSRNHTELMLKYFGGDIKIDNNIIKINPEPKLSARTVDIPGDISSASFFIVLGLLLPNSHLTINDININPTRIGIIDVLSKMGAKIEVKDIREFGLEKIANITVYSSTLKGITIEGEIIPRIIDEIPIIALAATQANSRTLIKDARELRVKESDRIKTIISELAKMGADIIETNDGMIINGNSSLYGTQVNSHNDHRIAMMLSIAAKISNGMTSIANSECASISFPNFYDTLHNITR